MGISRASKELFHLVVENVEDYAIFMADLEGNVLSWNPGVGRLLGYAEEEWVGLHVSEVFTPEDRAAGEPEREMGAALFEGRSEDKRWHVRKDGSRFWADGVLLLLKDDVGGLHGFARIMRDATARKVAEEEHERLLEAEREARAEAERRSVESERLASINRDIATSLDLAEVMKGICRAARELTGAEGAAFVTADGDEVYYAEEDAAVPLWKGRRFDASERVSGWSIANDAQVFIEDVSGDDRVPPRGEYAPTFVRGLAVVPVRAGGAVAEGAVCLYWARPHLASPRERSVLESLAGAASVALVNARLYERARRAAEEAEEANRLKDEFLAMLSHELRTPLTAILGWCQLIQRERLDPATAARAVEIVRRNADALQQLVNDLLDLSRIVAGKFRLEMEDVDLAAVVGAAADTVLPAAESKRVGLQVYAPSGVCTVAGDRSRLQQVVWNLLSNAVKFTPEGGKVEVRLEGGGPAVRMTVTDTGEGIDPGFLPYVFDRFRQAEAGTARNRGGLGLGLAIVRHLVELHGGAVTAESKGRGRGATFTVTLPIAGSREGGAEGRGREGRG